MTKSERRQAEAEAEALLNVESLQGGLAANNGSGGETPPESESAPKPEKGKGKGPNYGAAIAEQREQIAQLNATLAGLGDLIRGMAKPAAPPAPPTIAEQVSAAVKAEETAAALAVVPQATARVVAQAEQTARAIVEHPAHKAGQQNEDAAETVARQVAEVAKLEAHRANRFRLPLGMVPYRDSSTVSILVQKRDERGVPLYDKDGKEIMEKATTRCTAPVRSYVETMMRREFSNVEFRLYVDGKPTGAKIAGRYATSGRTSNPQFFFADPTFTTIDSNGNLVEWKGGGRGGMYFGIRCYQGAPIAEGATREEAEQNQRFAA